MKIICPFVLLVWPYLFFPAAYLDSLTSEGGLAWLITYCVLTPIVYIISIICALRIKDAKTLALWNMVLKLCHIPAYLFIFFYGIVVAFFSWAFLFFTPVILAILVVIDCLLLATTSSFGICALVRAKAKETVSWAFLAVNAVLHFIFVLDVISSILVFCKIRKKVPASQ